MLARKLHQEFPTYLSYFEGDGFSVGEEYHKNRNLLAEEISGVTGLAVMGGANHGRLFLFSYAVDEGDYFGLVAGASDTAGLKKMTRQAIEGIKAKHDAA